MGENFTLPGEEGKGMAPGIYERDQQVALSLVWKLYGLECMMNGREKFLCNIFCGDTEAGGIDTGMTADVFAVQNIPVN